MRFVKAVCQCRYFSWKWTIIIFLNSKYNTFVCVYLIRFDLNCINLMFPILYNNPNTSTYHIVIPMNPIMEQFDIYSNFDAFEDYKERFEIWTAIRKDLEDVNVVSHFLKFIEKEAYSLLKTSALSFEPISHLYATLKKLLLNHVKFTHSWCREEVKVHKTIHQGAKNFISLPRHSDTVRT